MKAKQPAYALATILVLLGVALFAAGALVSVSTLESKISLSSAQGVAAYYAAESGVQDAMWKLNHDPTFKTKLGANQFLTPLVYTLADLPSTGLSSTVTISGTSAGYATVSSKGSSANGGSFAATRTVQVTVFQSGGSLGGSIGTNAMMMGGGFTMTNANTAITVSGGDLYATGNVSVNLGGSGSFSIPGNSISTSGTYTGKGTVTYGTLNTSVPTVLPPGIDFSTGAAGYGNPANYTKAYDVSVPSQLTQFQNDITSAGGLVGPVTYVNGSLSFGTWAKGKTLTVHGLLVINGNFSVSNASPTPSITVLDPGSHISGILANGTVTVGNGNWDMHGVLYSSGSMQISNNKPMTIVGAMVAGGSLTIATGGQIALTFDSAVATTTFTGGDAYAAAIQHWEEEY